MPNPILYLYRWYVLKMRATKAYVVASPKSVKSATLLPTDYKELFGKIDIMGE